MNDTSVYEVGAGERGVGVVLVVGVELYGVILVYVFYDLEFVHGQFIGG